MKRLVTFVLMSGGIAVAPRVLLAQAEAKEAFDAGRQAFVAGQYEKARERFAAASQTDAKNPEVFLWLGRANYELGKVEEAITAWDTTLKLAPNEPYAAKMLQALRGDLTQSEQLCALVDVLIGQELYDSALRQADRVLADKALSDALKVRATLQKATAMVNAGQAAEVPAILHKLSIQHGKLVDPAQSALLLGQAYVRIGGNHLDDGLALLRKVAAEHANTPAAVVAQYELAVFDLGRAATPETVDALAKWVAANAEHPLRRMALGRLIEGQLALSKQQAPARQDSGLRKEDAAAIEAASQLVKTILGSAEAEAWAKRIVAQLDEQYGQRGAFAAAAAGADQLLKATLPPSARRVALDAAARYRVELAVRSLGDAITTGAALGNDLPPQLASAIAALDAINAEFPSRPAWAQQGALAERVRKLGDGMPWPAKPTELKAPMQWALRIALPVVRGSDEGASNQAIATVWQIVADANAAMAATPQRQVPVAVHAQLVEAVPVKHAQWQAVAWRQVDLLDALAAAQFVENQKAGEVEKNAKLGEVQQQVLAMLQRIVAQDARMAERAVQRLGQHLAPWIGQKQYAVAEEAYTQLGKALPGPQQKLARLAVARLWIGQALTEHERLAAARLAVGKGLDPLLRKALVELYDLQAGLPPENPLLQQVQKTWLQVVGHYRAMGPEYEAAALEAIGAKGANKVAAADALAAYALADLRSAQARVEVARAVQQHEGAKKLALTPGTRAAIDAWKAFITGNPGDPRVGAAADAALALSDAYERHAAYDVAAAIERELAAFAATQKPLALSTPSAPSVAERAALAAARTLDRKARTALDKARAEQGADAAPPQKLSEEFAAAIKAYKEFIAAHPDSILVGPALAEIQGVALKHAEVDAWDVAESIYADLSASKLELREPQRLELARAVCHMGKGMPDYAKRVLAALAVETPLATPDTTDRAGSVTVATSPGTRPAEDFFKDNLATGQQQGQFGMGGGAGGAASVPMPTLQPNAPAAGDGQALMAIAQAEAQRANRVAQLREETLQYDTSRQLQNARGVAVPPPPVLSEAELARLDAAFNAAYDILKAVRAKYPNDPAAAQARLMILAMADHWRASQQSRRAATLTQKFLADAPSDPQLPALRITIARDYLQHATMPIEKSLPRQAMLAEIAARFDAARKEYAAVVAEFPAEKALRQEAQWELAGSYLAQARAISAHSPTLARGQYVRAARELQRVARENVDHPRIATVPQALWSIADELSRLNCHEEAILVFTDLINFNPMHELARAAAPRIAAAYQQNLNRPLRAVESYLEINSARGGSDAASQQAIYAIGAQLRGQKRWIEALAVLEVFVGAFPQHPSAGEALAMIGQIHQENEAWKDAIAAYRRVIDEYASTQFVQQAKWSIAECTINLSQWREAIAAYEDYVAAYPKDGNVAEANRRIGVLKDLARYQALVDEAGQRKAFDAQFQIASIIQGQLKNPHKAIIEYRKVTANYPKSHLADDALFNIGSLYLEMGLTDKARESLAAMASQYPDSNLADDALVLVGRSYEEESQRLASLTRGSTIVLAQERTQREAYQNVQKARDDNRRMNSYRIDSLKKSGKGDLAELAEASQAANEGIWNGANFEIALAKAEQDAESLTAAQLADRQDRINAALRRAVEAYANASKVPGADKAGDALLRMSVIYDEQLKDSAAALATWQEIVRQFSGNAVAEEASWRIAQYHDRKGAWNDAVEAYKAFLRNYRRSPRAGQAQFSVAEGYEHLNMWVEAMDAYTNYLTNFPDGPLAQKAKEQINWIKTYRL